jgi:hypothetical protein
MAHRVNRRLIVVGLKSNLHQQLPEATLSPVGFISACLGWTLVHQVK